MSVSTRNWVIVMVGGLAMAAAVAAEAASEAKEILATAGPRTGLCVHLGCGQAASAGLTAALAENSGLLVHGLACDETALARARKEIEARTMFGRAMAEKVPPSKSPLPYLSDLASLAVVEDLAALAAQGVSKEEIMRVLAPNGVLCTREGGKWTKTVKPRPKEMDDWPHPLHGADGNMVSSDKLLKFPLGFRWIDGLPVNINAWAACRAWIIAGGRVYTLSSNELENLENHSKKHYLGARDAFSGIPLWKLNLETTDDGAHLTWRNVGALVADEKRVYAVQGEKPIIVDGASGQLIAACETKYKPHRLALLNGVLLAACWESRSSSNDEVEGGSLWATWLPKMDSETKSSNGAVEAFEAESGKAKWSVPLAAYMLLASDGVVYALTHTGNPVSDSAVKKDPKLDRRKDWERQVVALDLQSGKEKWRLPHGKLGNRADLELGCAGPGYVVVYKREKEERGVSVLSAADGSILWQTKGGGTWTPVVDGLLWQGRKRYDLKTGAVKDQWPVDPGDQGCTPSLVVNNIITRTRGCGYEQVILEDGKAPRSQGLQYGGARGGCMEGMVPANGMFYTAQNNCRCSPAQVYGFLAVGPVGAVPEAADFEKARPVEKGPAFGTPDEGTNAAEDWVTFRHDAERSGGTAVKLPDNLKELWKAQAAQPAAGPLAGAWKARLASCLSAPVCAAGQVLAAATDAAEIVALDAVTGKKIWSATLGGRIDTPPTIHRGLCLVGSHDGWVYALRAKDGQLAWRARVAPWERRLVAYGEVESVWPAVGTVLVHDNVAYVNAGRTSESDGGIAVVALDPSTGNQVWGKEIGPGPQRQNDMLSLCDGAIAWHHIRLDPKTGSANPAAPVSNNYSQGGAMDGTWTLVGRRRSGNAYAIGKPAETKNKEQTTVDLVAWNDAQTVSPSFAMARQKADGTVGKLNSADYAWKPALPSGAQVEALALAGNAVVYAGRIKGAQAGEPAGFLCVLSAADGKPLAEFKLEAPPTYDGLAVARERIYVSLQNGNIVCFGK